MPNVPELLHPPETLLSETEVKEVIEETPGPTTRAFVEEVQTNTPEESTVANTFLGGEAGEAIKPKGEGNVTFGAKAAKSLTEGSGNIVLGQEAMKAGTTAASNIAIGRKALEELVSGEENISVGNSTLKTATGEKNTAVGSQAGSVVTTGKENTFVGYVSGDAKAGSQNVAIGALARSGGESGKENVSVGYEAGEGKKGSANIFIGYKASKSAATASNKLVVANNATKAIIEGVMSETEASQEIGFLGAAPAKRPKVKGKRTTEFAEVLKTLCKGLGELGLITDETEAG